MLNLPFKIDLSPTLKIRSIIATRDIKENEIIAVLTLKNELICLGTSLTNYETIMKDVSDEDYNKIQSGQEVIWENNEIKSMFAFEASCFSPYLHYIGGWSVINEH